MELRDDRDDKRDIYNGFGNTLARASELVGAPLLFAFFGWLLDRWLGTDPVLLIVLGLFGLAGIVVRTYYQYAHDMQAHESRLPGRHNGEVTP